MNVKKKKLYKECKRHTLKRRTDIKSSKKTKKKEKLPLRSAIGQFNWIFNISRPVISFQVSNISLKIKDAFISYTKETNKIIKFVLGKKKSYHLSIISFEKHQNCNALCCKFE